MKEVIELLNKISIQLDNRELTTMTLRETSKYSGIGYNKLREIVNIPNTDFPFFKIGTRVTVNRKIFDEWLSKISEEHREI